MAKSPTKVRRQPLLTFFSCFTTVGLALLAYGYKSTSKNIYNQFPAILSILNPELYPNDFYVQEMTQFTPRFYYYHLIAFGVKSGLELPIVCFGLYFVAFGSFLLGLYAIGKQFNQSRLSATVLAVLGLAATINGRIGFADLFRTDPLPATLAMGLVVWGFYFCFRQKWTLGYLFFGLTCLLQFLVGILPGVLMSIPLLISARERRHYRQVLSAFFVLAGCACFVYIPMLLTGNTGSSEIGNEEFVYLYSYVRHPHHLLFSSFGLTGERGWLNFILFTVGGLFCIENSQTLSNRIKTQLKIVVFVACTLLIANYIFIELYPIAFISKLQFARTTPFSQLMILVGISVAVEEEYRRGNLPIACLVIISAILREGGLLLMVIGLSLYIDRRNRESTQDRRISSTSFPWILISALFASIYYGLYFVSTLVLFVLIVFAGSYKSYVAQRVVNNNWSRALSIVSLIAVFAWYFFPYGIVVCILLTLWWSLLTNKSINTKKVNRISVALFFLFMILYQHYDLLLMGAVSFPLLLDRIVRNPQRQRIVYCCMATILTAYIGLGVLNVLPPTFSSFFQSRVAIAFQSDDDVAVLARKFRQISPVDASILVPPLDHEFRYYSQRSVPFTFKSFPFTDEGIKTWQQRLESFTGKSIFSPDKLDINSHLESGAILGLLAISFEKLDDSEIVSLAKQYDANYILTRLDWHPHIEGAVIAQQGDWIVYRIK